MNVKNKTLWAVFLMIGLLIMVLSAQKEQSPVVISQTISETLEEQAVSLFWNSLPEATVTVDTMHQVMDMHYAGGIIFSDIKNDSSRAVRYLLFNGAVSAVYQVPLSLSSSMGNYVIAIRNGIATAITAKHNLLLEENGTIAAPQGWTLEPLKDIAYHHAPESKNFSRVTHVLDSAISIDQKTVEVIGYKIYPEKPYMVRFRIRGMIHKIPSAFENEKNPKEKYLMKLPLSFPDNLEGLSGSGVYLYDEDQKSSNTIVGVLTRKNISGHTETDGFHLTRLGIRIERLY